MVVTGFFAVLVKLSVQITPQTSYAAEYDFLYETLKTRMDSRLQCFFQACSRLSAHIMADNQHEVSVFPASLSDKLHVVSVFLASLSDNLHIAPIFPASGSDNMHVAYIFPTSLSDNLHATSVFPASLSDNLNIAPLFPDPLQTIYM